MTVPDAKAMLRRLEDLSVRLKKPVESKLSRYKAELDRIAASHVLTSPDATLKRRKERLDILEDGLHKSISAMLGDRGQALSHLTAQLEALSPLAVLSRGYALAKDGDGSVVTTATAVSVGDELSLRFVDGEASATVTSVSLLT